MPNRSRLRPLSPDFELFTIGAERASHLSELVTAARADLNPRNFAEGHLVDDLAISKWRICRVALMEKAIFEHQNSSFRPRSPRDADGKPLLPHEDIYHLAMAHAPESHAVVLAALGRLDARYSRQFCNALRLLIAIRRGTPPPVAAAPVPQPATPESTLTESTRKDETACVPSPTAPPAI